LSPW